MKRQLIIDLETSALTPEVGDIVRFRAESVSDPDDEFDEWVKPPRSVRRQNIWHIRRRKLTESGPRL
ncbi:hypothetical protein, partial [Novosphingobium acidiphilum]|uniref:hypothetical protein n=1 Tax=Novosphingobium acidiphilum TaxID=505248 RepID=UPI0012EB41D1